MFIQEIFIFHNTQDQHKTAELHRPWISGLGYIIITV